MNPDSDTTTLLLEEINSGEVNVDRLFDRHRASLKAAIELRMDQALRGRLDASDIVQDAQAEAFRRLEDFLRRRPMPFHLWLRKMAQERLIMARRYHVDAGRRAVGRELPLPNRSTAIFAQQILAAGDSPSTLISQEELTSKVRRAVGQLSEINREILLMRVYEGLSYDEIACVLEIDAATARKRNGRALIQLHKFLAADGLSD
jgi:RNA polymerase sigma-70 factor (ECF subfamily)